MKTTVSQYDFTEAFRTMGRGDQFSYEALKLLFDWFEDMDESCDTETELDVIAICCEFTEDTWEAIADSYSIDTSDCEDDDESKQAVEEYLLENTSLVGVLNDGSMVYQDF